MKRRYEPSQLEPMACDAVSRIDDLKGDPGDYLLEVKYDGFRLVAIVEEDRVDFLTRGGKWVGVEKGSLPYVEEELLQLFPPGTVLDGEIVATRSATAEEVAAGKPGIIVDFEYVQSVMLSTPDRALMLGAQRPLRYMVFDIMAFGVPEVPASVDCTFRRLEARRSLLDSYFDDAPNLKHVELSPAVAATQENHDAWVQAGFEGTVAKRKDSHYLFGGRGKGWYKCKATWSMDAIVVGYVPGQGKNIGKVGSIIFAQPTDDNERLKKSAQFALELFKSSTTALKKGEVSEPIYISQAWMTDSDLGELAIRGCARGFTDALMDEMTADFGSFVGRVVEISHNGLMAGEVRVRHPQFLRFRDPEDKPVTAVDWRHR